MQQQTVTNGSKDHSAFISAAIDVVIHLEFFHILSPFSFQFNVFKLDFLGILQFRLRNDTWVCYKIYSI